MPKISAPHLPCAKCKEVERTSGSYCKPCRGKVSSTNYLKNKTTILARQSSYRKTAEYKSVDKRSKDKFMVKQRARAVVYSAIKSGKLDRVPCEVKACKNPKSEAHHNDYSKPLEVIFLCSKHHAACHKVFKPINGN